MQFGRDHLVWQHAAEREWLVTNGLGGFAASSIVGMNTRRYHGLLMAALEPPGNRTLLVAKLEERICVQGQAFDLGTNQYPDTIFPQGYQYLLSFTPDPWPTYLFQMPGALLQKQILMVYGENATVIRYRLLYPSAPLQLFCQPLICYRDYHHLQRQNPWPFSQTRISDRAVLITAFADAVPFLLCADRGIYQSGGLWFYQFEYVMEKKRGLDYLEDLYCPGEFRVSLQPGEEVTFLCAAAAPQTPRFLAWQKEGLPPGAGAALAAEAARRQDEVLMTAQRFWTMRGGQGTTAQQEFARELVRAADAFVVQRQPEGWTIIAGYPWFMDWGRDTMIALPGLTLVTGRFAVAKAILTTYAKYLRRGLLPNCFPDQGCDPAYNTVDAALWFVNAVYSYWQYSGDFETVQEVLGPAVYGILSAYAHGTDYGIKMDTDGLITAGTGDLQLTWMDAKVGGHVVTPRHGKAVEINALWYNALRIGAAIAQASGQKDFSQKCTQVAEQVQANFWTAFWDEEAGYLADVVCGNERQGYTRDLSLRPNQLLALSLPYPIVLPRCRQEAGARIIARVFTELYTGYALRSLSPRHADYRGEFTGDHWQRDHAYHQGTAWSWLLGPFATSLARFAPTPERGRDTVWQVIAPVRTHLAHAGLGQVSEVFAGDYPHTPGGCFAQAWGVGELLRVLGEDLGVAISKTN